MRNDPELRGLKYGRGVTASIPRFMSLIENAEALDNLRGRNVQKVV